MIKGLEALRRIDIHLPRHEETQEKEFIEYVSIIEKELKALEIIKKYIDISCPFKSACYIKLNDESELISQEEYDLLKEVCYDN